MISITVDRKDTEAILQLSRLVSEVSPSSVGTLMAMVRGSGDGLTLTIKRAKQGRTRAQENYYRKWCGAFARWCGMTPDEMHEELLCMTFGSEEVHTKMGIKRRPLRRSADASINLYGGLIENLQMTAAQMGFVVPDPGEIDEAAA